MAKKTKTKKDEKYISQYLSPCGSHAAMIDEAETEKLKDKKLGGCRGERGLYITERKRLDNGLADASRYSGEILGA